MNYDNITPFYIQWGAIGGLFAGSILMRVPGCVPAPKRMLEDPRQMPLEMVKGAKDFIGLRYMPYAHRDKYPQTNLRLFRTPHLRK
jgi:hypothetical protein